MSSVKSSSEIFDEMSQQVAAAQSVDDLYGVTQILLESAPPTPGTEVSHKDNVLPDPEDQGSEKRGVYLSDEFNAHNPAKNLGLDIISKYFELCGDQPKLDNDLFEEVFNAVDGHGCVPLLYQGLVEKHSDDIRAAMEDARDNYEMDQVVAFFTDPVDNHIQEDTKDSNEIKRSVNALLGIYQDVSDKYFKDISLARTEDIAAPYESLDKVAWSNEVRERLSSQVSSLTDSLANATAYNAYKVLSARGEEMPEGEELVMTEDEFQAAKDSYFDMLAGDIRYAMDNDVFPLMKYVEPEERPNVAKKINFTVNYLDKMDFPPDGMSAWEELADQWRVEELGHDGAEADGVSVLAHDGS